MCEITVSNLHDDFLNRQMFLILGSLGSVVHDDGWGFSDEEASIFKSQLPMHYTLNSGGVLKPKFKKNPPVFIGHIRQASPLVPVCEKNSHPFLAKGIVFEHNGKLTPRNEKDFIMMETVPDMDDKTGQQKKDKTGELLTKEVKRSDSIIFFEKFIEKFFASTPQYTDEFFLKVFKETMELFDGKFAMVFRIKDKVYVARGKTAELGICFLRESSKADSKILGWVINTNRKLLDDASTLLSNIQQMNGGKPMHFTIPDLLDENTVYRAEGTFLEKIGEVKETTAPVVYTAPKSYAGGATNFTQNTTGKGGGSTSTKIPSGEVEEYTQIVYNFMIDYSLSTYDIQNILIPLFNASAKELTLEMLKHFAKKVIPLIRNMVKKDTRKALKKACHGVSVGYSKYEGGKQYPWMFNPKDVQKEFISKGN